MMTPARSPGADRPHVAAAVVTYDRPQDCRRLMERLGEQTLGGSPAPALDTLCLVDSGSSPVAEAPQVLAAELLPGVELDYVRSEANLGGAGGFALAILHAIASGAEWVWVMDDDALPLGSDALVSLLRSAEERNLEAVLPVVVNPADHSRLSFGFRLDGKMAFSRRAVEEAGFIDGIGHFFNGALIRTEVFFRVGVPDLKLFIRGDETDFMLRLRAAGVRFGTTAAAALAHPAAETEVQPVLGDRWHVLVPDTDFKREHFYRNRGYLISAHRRPKSFVADAIGYPVHFVRTRDLAGFKHWLGHFAAGLRGRGFSAPKPQPGSGAPKSTPQSQARSPELEG